MEIFFTELFTDLNWDIFKAVLIIIGLDLILGGDNAVVIAMASRNLPERLQNKAIALGTILAVFIRFLLACVAIYLLTIPYLQLIGGLFLLYIAFSLLKDEEDDQEIQASGTLFGAVKTIVIADVVMGFDNVLAISAASNQNFRLILFGLAVSVNEKKLETFIESVPYIQIGLPIFLILVICFYGRSKNIPIKA